MKKVKQEGYIIKWRSWITGKEGQSAVPRSKAIYEDWAARQNRRWPELDHWVEPVAGEGRR